MQGRLYCVEQKKVTRVFVTSTVYSTNFGGVAAADTNCQNAADGQTLGGTWRAWLSDTTGNSPATNLTQQPNPYVLLDGTVIANNWADLTDGTLAAGINIFEDGTASPGGDNVFTGTAVDGTALVGGGQCGNWTIAPGNGTTFMNRGLTADATGYWTDRGTEFCNVQGRLYCVEEN